MARFDKQLWEELAPRFRELRDGKNVEKFLADHDLIGLKWRMYESARAGTNVESLVKLCRALDISPTWLLFGRGPKKLPRDRSTARSRLKILGTDKE